MVSSDQPGERNKASEGSNLTAAASSGLESVQASQDSDGPSVTLAPAELQPPPAAVTNLCSEEGQSSTPRLEESDAKAAPEHLPATADVYSSLREDGTCQLFCTPEELQTLWARASGAVAEERGSMKTLFTFESARSWGIGQILDFTCAGPFLFIR
jgi:hypothetical protein